MDLYDTIKDAIISDGNRKIKEESLEEFLNSFKKSEIFTLPSLYMMNSTDVLEVYLIKDKSKKELIKYIKENITKIINIIFSFIEKNDIKLLKKIIDNLKEKNYDITETGISLTLIMFLKKFLLAKFEYSENELKMFMPKEFVYAFDKALNNENTIKENKKVNSISEYIIDVVNTYGIIDYESLYKLFNKQMFKLSKEKLLLYLNELELATEKIYVYDYDKTLICNMKFTEETKAINFYEMQESNYKNFSKDEFNKISSGCYIKKLNEYENFVDFLNEHFSLTDDDIEEIIDLVVLEYIWQKNMLIDEADKNLYNNINSMFDVSYDEINEMKDLINKLYLDYPKWIKRGNK